MEARKIGNATDSHFDIALSFAGEDREIAEQLSELLTERGVKVFYDRHMQSELWGKDLYQHLQSIYRDKARYCIVFVSKAYADRFWTRHELSQALARAFRENREYILPLRLDDTELPELNQTLGYIDLRTTELATVSELVLQKLCNESEVEDVIRTRTDVDYTVLTGTPPRESIITPFVNLIKMRVPGLIAFWIQLIFSSFILSALGNGFVATILVFSMLAVFPLAIAISRLAGRNVFLSFLIGGVVTATLLGFFAYAIVDWAVRPGILYGGFYGATLASHFSKKSDKTYLLYAFANTIIILGLLLVIQCTHLSVDCLQMDESDVGRSLMAPIVAIVLWLVSTPVINPLRQYVEAWVDDLLSFDQLP